MAFLSDSLPDLPKLNSYLINTPQTGAGIIGTATDENGKIVSTPVGTAVGNAVSGAKNLLGMGGGEGFTIQRIVLIVLGLITIGIGLVMFKPVQQNVVKISEKAAEAAEIA